MEPVGKVLKLFGRDGRVIVRRYAGFPDPTTIKEPLWTYIDQLAVPLFIESIEGRGRDNALVTFADLDTPERAGLVIGRELFAASPAEADGNDPSESLEALAGFTVEFTGRDERGELESFIDHAANPLFVVRIDGREVLIPATESFIAEVDFDARRIEFDLPEGLLDLYL